MSERAVRIDFNRAGHAVEVVDRWELRHPERTWGVGPLRRRPTLRIPVHRLWVKAELPPCLRVRGGGEVVTLEPRLPLNGGSAPRRSAELRDFTLQSFSFPYDIVLDPGQIEDVLDDGVSSAEIQVEVGSEWKDGPPAGVHRFSVRIELVREHARPRCWIELEPAFEAGYEHRRGERARLGTFWVENATSVRYAHPFDCTAVVRGEGWPVPGPAAVSFGAAHEVEGATGGMAGVGGLVAADGAGAPAVQVTADGRLEVRGLAPWARVGVPLYLDLAQVPNPDDVAELTATVAVEYRTEGRTASPPDCRARYRVLRDRRTTALLAVLRAADEERRLQSGSVVALDEGMQWSQGRSGLLECFTLRLGNSAESGSGRVELRGLAITFDDTAGGAPGIRWREGGCFLVNGAPASDQADQQVFPDGVGAFRDLSVAFRHADVEAVPGGAALVGCALRCEVREVEAEGSDAPWREFRADVRFRVERDLGPEWLAVDFGTSAIVVARHASGMGEVPLVNLQEPLLRRLSEVDANPIQVAEFGTPFLSSAISLNALGRMDAPARADSIVRLAPVRGELNASPYRIPYLKALIGTTDLPDLGGALAGYKYLTPEGETRVFAEHPLRTDVVLRETYARLVADYVVPATGGAPPAKAVFSVPNSFTPRHVDQLRSLIAARFPELSREYLSFISESDAVACFYLAGWSRLNAGRPAAAREALRSGDEHVLVYDMGAGTLDLTYLRIRSDPAGHQVVTIVGRMGRSTAGNYLDYLIAREIVREHGPRFREAVFGAAAFEHALVARDSLKRLVQEQVKPRLDEDGTIPLPLELVDEPVEVDLAELRASPAIQEFLRASTADVLENFFALFPSPEGRRYERGGVPLDTVVLSGRSMQLDLLRGAVEVELAGWAEGEAPYVVRDLDAQTLKSAVVQGALQFAALYRRQGPRARVRIHNRNLQARYGILYNDPLDPGRLCFKELLNPSTRPISSEPVVEDGLTIFSYDTDVFDADPTNDHRSNFVDLSGTAVAYFVQSFAADTAAQASAGRYEYITRMAEFTAQQVGYGARPDRVPVRVTIDEKNQMRVRLGQQTDDPMAPLRMNLHDSPSFRASLWPFLPGE